MLRVTEHKLQRTSYRLHVTEYKSQVTCYVLHVTRVSLQATGCRLQATSSNHAIFTLPHPEKSSAASFMSSAAKQRPCKRVPRTPESITGARPMESSEKPPLIVTLSTLCYMQDMSRLHRLSPGAPLCLLSTINSHTMGDSLSERLRASLTRNPLWGGYGGDGGRSCVRERFRASYGSHRESGAY